MDIVPFYEHGFIEIPVWKSSHITNKVWHEIV